VQNFLLNFIKELKQPVPSISITLFRLCFSAILLIQTYHFIVSEFIDKNIIKPVVLFPFINGLHPVSNVNLILLGYIMLIANAGMLLNKFARFSTIIFFSCFTYFWILDKGYFNNHYYFISLICFIVFLIEKESSFSKNLHTPKISIFSLQLMIFIVYFIAGLNKLNPYWLFDFQPIRHILELKADITNNPFFKKEILIMGVSYLGLIFDLSIGFFLFFKRTRLFAFLAIVLFHLTNYWIFKDVGEIGIFPFLMISTIVIFIDPIYLNKLFHLNDKPVIQKTNSIFLNKFLVIFLIIQIILPFRHFLFHGHVDYNGIGQRFSWRMKIMYKESEIDYFITNIMTREKYNVNIKTMLTNRQYNNLKYFPDLIVPLAKKIQIEAMEKFDLKHAKITCEYQTSFMGKNKQLLFSPTLDLTKIKKSQMPNKWLFPLKK